jgi:hypothetical protein
MCGGRGSERELNTVFQRVCEEEHPKLGDVLM